MINLLSLRCSLAFAPYLRSGIAEFLTTRSVAPQVVRQGGTGLIIRSEGELVLRYQDRQCQLGPDEAAHYGATLDLRAAVYDVNRMTGEIVISNFGGSILLSHPQSELWLEPKVAAALVQMSRHTEAPVPTLPEWLNAAEGGRGLLLSDQRNGRWVLLGEDHIDEIERRLESLAPSATAPPLRPPAIDVKGLAVHLQSAFGLARTLEDFGNGAEPTEYEEIIPGYTLSVSASTEGLELRVSGDRVALTRREARKWSSLISAELHRLNALQLERGGIRTVFADVADGRWVMQWGDELLVRLDSSPARQNEPLAYSTGEFTVLLDIQTSSCVALTETEAAVLCRQV